MFRYAVNSGNDSLELDYDNFSTTHIHMYANTLFQTVGN